MTSQRLKGSCLCGSITYEAEKIETRIGHCHCSMCRKFNGAAFSTFAKVKLEHFRWLSGEDLLKGYNAENGTVRPFCSN